MLPLPHGGPLHHQQADCGRSAGKYSAVDVLPSRSVAVSIDIFSVQ